MEEVKKSSVSVGLIVRKLLVGNAAVKERVNKVFPVAVDKAELPYVLYRKAGYSEQGVKKGGLSGAETVIVEVVALAATYEKSVEIAEAVRTALDGAHGRDEATGLTLRSSVMTDCEEGWENNAYLQDMTFEMRL